MTPEELNNIASELKRLGGELNLSDQQKDQLRTFLTEKYEQLQEYKKHNPNITKEDVAQYIAKNRAAGREKIEKFLPRSSREADRRMAHNVSMNAIGEVETNRESPRIRIGKVVGN